NRNFQLYGRTLRLVTLKPGADEASNRAKANAADDQYHVFGGFDDEAPGADEFTRHGLLGFGGYQFADRWFTQRAPYACSWSMDGTKLAHFDAEYVCKKLAGRTAAHAGTPD